MSVKVGQRRRMSGGTIYTVTEIGVGTADDPNAEWCRVVYGDGLEFEWRTYFCDEDTLIEEGAES